MGVPATTKNPDLTNLPPALAEAFGAGSPMQQMLGAVLSELGGIDFIVEWAEEAPGEFMRLVMAANPAPVQAGGSNGAQLHVHLPEGLQPGPLDTHVVSEQ